MSSTLTRERQPVGLLAEHWICTGKPIFAGGVKPEAWPRLHLMMAERDADYCAIPLYPDGVFAGLLLFADRLFWGDFFAAAQPLSETDEMAEYKADEAAGAMLALAHDPVAGRAILSELWRLIATGENVGETLGVFMGRN